MLPHLYLTTDQFQEIYVSRWAERPPLSHRGVKCTICFSLFFILFFSSFSHLLHWVGYHLFLYLPLFVKDITSSLFIHSFICICCVYSCMYLSLCLSCGQYILICVLSFKNDVDAILNHVRISASCSPSRDNNSSISNTNNTEMMAVARRGEQE